MANSSQYYSYMTSKEELQYLRQFELLYEESKDGSKDKNSNSEEGAMQFGDLPPDWIISRHCNGMPVYMHRGTRVCTDVKPYFLGNGNIESHDIPMSAILCIAYKKALDEEKKHLDIEKNQIKKLSDSADTNEETDGTEFQEIQKVESDDVESTEDGDEPRCLINKSADSTKPVDLPGQYVLFPPRDNMIWKTQECSSDQLNATAIQQVGNTQESHEEGAMQFGDLPPDWIISRHCNGMPVYMHRGTRVCTDVKPYFLGNGNIESHDIPMSAILCIAYKKALDEEKKHLDIEKKQIKRLSNSADTNEETDGTEFQEIQKVESDNVESNEDGDEPRCLINKSADSTKPVDLPGHYVLFPPRDNMIWKTQECSSDQLNATAIQQVGNTQESHGKATNSDLTMNVHFSCYLSVFHELVRKSQGEIPVYEAIEIVCAASAWTSYEATAYVGDVKYGEGRGPSKQKAMVAAARDATQTLLLQIIDELRIWKSTELQGGNYLHVFHEVVQLVRHEVPVYTYTQTTSARTLYEATAFVGDVKYGEGRGSSKQEAKAAAARDSVYTLVLQLMEEIDRYIARPPANELNVCHLLRLYGSRCIKGFKEKKTEERTTLLQERKNALKQSDEAVSSVGTPSSRG